MTAFATPHDQAFRDLGARAPGQQWSAFDVPLERAKAGDAKLLVTTIWNFHHYVDEKGNRIPNENGIAKDVRDETLWYRIDLPVPGRATKTRVAHYNRFRLAFDNKAPILGVLKDVKTKKCSLENLFDCVNPIMQLDEQAVWIQLLPRGAIGCDVRDIDIRALTGATVDAPTLQVMEEQFQGQVAAAMRSPDVERDARLAVAVRIPRRIEVTTCAFERNPDVVAKVLLRAAGKCEACLRPAPFMRKKDGTPYLEVHHQKPLADGGEDTVENAIATCPNCHREKHYG